MTETMPVVEWADPPEPDPANNAVTVGRWGGYRIQVVSMLFNDRLVLTPDHCPQVYDHGWCYPKGGAAMLAALVWDPASQAEPAGYIKRATPTVRKAGETAQ